MSVLSLTEDILETEDGLVVSLEGDEKIALVPLKSFDALQHFSSLIQTRMPTSSIMSLLWMVSWRWTISSQWIMLSVFLFKTKLMTKAGSCSTTTSRTSLDYSTRMTG